VVDLPELSKLTEDEAREFLDSNVLTSGMEMPLTNLAPGSRQPSPSITENETVF